MLRLNICFRAQFYARATADRFSSAGDFLIGK